MDDMDDQAQLIRLDRSGECRTCNGHLTPGEMVWYDGVDDEGQRMWHEDCLPGGKVTLD